VFDLIHQHYHQDDQVRRQLDQVLTLLVGIRREVDTLVKQGGKMDTDVQNLVDEVAQVKGDVASTKAFIAGLEQRITDLLAAQGENLKPETRAALTQMFADLKDSSGQLQAAIANDPNATPAP